MIKQVVRYIWFLLITVSLHATAQDTDSIQFILDSTFKHSPFFGNVLIAKNGKVIVERSYGYADAINNKKLAPTSSFQVASISKQFTAYAIMILKNNRLLDYDDFVIQYIPEFPYSTITIRHLLTHTSGLPDFWNDIRLNLDTLKSNGNKDVIDYLHKHQLPLTSEPGAKFQYADIGYDFLATIIENVSGNSYEKFISENIFEPLKMKDSHAYMVTDIRRINNLDLAIGHVNVNGQFLYAHLQPSNNFVSYLGDFYGDGSIVTTTRDLLLWSEALKNCTLLPCSVQEEAYAPTKYNGTIIYARKNPDLLYGFGWFIKEGVSGKIGYHTGGHPGNVHAIYRLFDNDITFIFLSNAETKNLRAMRNSILLHLDK